MNPLEIFLSFMEGVALIASPCILPILPLMLGASVEGGRKRPFGIITGFVLAFTAFAMLSRSLIAALGIDVQFITYIALFFLTAFALVLLSERLSERFSRATQRFANAGGALTSSTKDGFFSGITIGMFIGLIWTPCAGPILAAVLVQIIRQDSDLNALLLVGAFAFGAGIPMLVISLMGRKIMNKLGFFTRHPRTIRRVCGIAMLLAVAVIASGSDIVSLFSAQESPSRITAAGLQEPLPTPYPAPELAGIQTWLNSSPLTLKELKGKVVLIDFWTYSCINCVRTLPYLTRWDQAYRDKGLVIIGVHAPEFAFEKKVENVRQALTSHHISYPVAIDNEFDTWVAFKNSYWPTHYLIDTEGKVVYVHAGEGNYAQTEHNIRYLLGIKEDAELKEEDAAFSEHHTPETYLGYGRSEHFASPEITIKEKTEFHFPSSLPLHHWALSGTWRREEQYSVAEEAGAKLQLHFTAGKVFVVLGSQQGKTVNATLTLNGKPLVDTDAGKDVKDGIITVDEHTLYEVVNQESVKEGVLEITTDSAGLEAYAFTFGE